MIFKAQHLQASRSSGGRVRVTEDKSLSAPGARVYRYELIEPADGVETAFEKLQRTAETFVDDADVDLEDFKL